MTSWLTRARVITAMIGATIAASSIPAGTALAADEWGRAVVRKPGKTSTLTVKDGASSSGQKVKVIRRARGSYRVKFRGLQADYAHVQVTVLSSGPDLCHLAGSGPTGRPYEAHVHCYDRHGRFKDVRFIVNMVRSSAVHAGPRLGYAWFQNVSNPVGTTTEGHHLYRHVSSGGATASTILDEGKYRYAFGGSNTGGGNWQLTPQANPKVRICRITSFGGHGGAAQAETRCTLADGTEKRTRTNALFTSSEGLKGDGGGPWAYLYAERPKANAYIPMAQYRAAFPPGTPSIKRKSKGTYLVKLPSMPLGGSVQITTVDPKKRCHASEIRKRNGPQKIGVACFKAGGGRKADAKFLLSYAR